MGVIFMFNAACYAGGSGGEIEENKMTGNPGLNVYVRPGLPVTK
jgi:hypothetical protein